jgi:hypothetical protein
MKYEVRGADLIQSILIIIEIAWSIIKNNKISKKIERKNWKKRKIRNQKLLLNELWWTNTKQN